jgi:hypothetical protein
VQLLDLPVCSSSSTDVRPVSNWACHWNTCARLNLLSPNASWIIVRVSVALFPRLAQNLMHTRCSFLWSIVKIVKGHVRDSNKRLWKVSTSTQLYATWHTVSLDMVVLPSTGVSCYHKCCIDDDTSLENLGYNLVVGTNFK